MLSSLRQTTRFLSPCLPRRAFLSSISRKQEDEAVRIITELVSDGPSSSTEVTPENPGPVGPSPADLDTMHHFIPPAQSPILQLFTTMIMKDGKYAAASRRISAMLLHIHVMTQSQPMPIVEHAVRLASPAVKVNRQKKGGGKIMEKPVALSERQRTRMGIDWIIEGANGRGRPGKSIEDRLAREILDTIRGKSKAIEKKKKLHEAVMISRGNIGKK